MGKLTLPAQIARKLRDAAARRGVLPTRRSGWCATTFLPTPLRPSTRASRWRMPGNWLERRVRLHAGARLVAEHGRDRDLRVGALVPQAKVGGRGDSEQGG